MTITALPTRNEYTATAGQTVFTYTFKIFEDTDINVYQTQSGQTADDTTDIITAYTVAGTGDEDGGTITLTTPASSGDLITIVSDIPAYRTEDYQNNGDFRPDAVNNDFDRVVSLTKQVEDLSNRALLFQESQQGASQLDLPEPEAGKYLRWNTTVDGVENVDLPDSADVSTLRADLLAPGIGFGADLVTNSVKDVATLADLKSHTPTIGKTIYIKGRTTANDGGQGHFVGSGVTTDLSTEVTADTLSGIYAAPTSDPTGASGAWVRQWSASVSVKWFGAIGNGVNDDSDAVIAAKVYVQSVISSGNSGIWNPGGITANPTSGTAPELFLPSGVYSISKSLSGTAQELNYMTIRGVRAAIVPTTQSMVVFGGVGYNNTFKGLVFRGGSKHIVGNNNNTNSTMLDISDCEFINAEDAAIDLGIVTNGFHSASAVIRQCKLRASSTVVGDGFLLSGGCDKLVMRDCWLQTTRPIGIELREGDLLLENCTGVPESNTSGPTGSVWIDVTGETEACILRISHFRGGGEGGGRSVVRWSQDIDAAAPRVPSALEIKDSGIYASTDKYLVIFEALPNIVDISGISGLISNYGFYFDSSISDQNILDFCSYGAVKLDGFNDGRVVLRPYGPNNDAQNVFTSKITSFGVRWNINSAVTKQPIPLTDLIVSNVPGFGWITASSDVSRSSVASLKGYTYLQYTSVSDVAFRSAELATFIDATTTDKGAYNFSLHIKVLAGDWNVLINLGPYTKNYDIEPGTYNLILPFYFLNGTGVADSDYDKLKITTSTLNTGSVIQLGRAVITDNKHTADTETIIFEGDTTPTVELFIQGDELRYNDPATAGFRGEICTVSGTPGTWKTYGAVTP